MKKYNVIITGASFAGLAVASKIKNKDILLIDQKDIGSNVRSACGTTIDIVEKVKCKKSILQIFDKAAIHTKNKEINIPLIQKFCTIDYNKFCNLFNKQNNAEFLKANVKRTDRKIVFTDKGNFKADIIVDCTGWQAVLASSLKKNYVHKNMLSFGIETEILYKKDDKLRFFIDDKIIENGAGWIFPCKEKARFGIGSYNRNIKLLSKLKKFVKGYNLKIGKIHGGYFCYCLKKPIVKNIFVVGCAAGQTLPLTGEGIRRSIKYGLICGEIIQNISDKKISLKQGQREYEEIALKHSDDYKLLLKLQDRLPKTSNWQINLAAKLLTIKPFVNYAWKKYERI